MHVTQAFRPGPGSFAPAALVKGWLKGVDT